jgi:hypothetical protein
MGEDETANVERPSGGRRDEHVEMAAHWVGREGMAQRDAGQELLDREPVGHCDHR